MEWFAGEAPVPKPGDATYFKTDVAPYVQYRCPPLPLLSLSPCQHKHKPKIPTRGDHLCVISSPDKRPHLLCVGRCCMVAVYQCLEHNKESCEGPRPQSDDRPHLLDDERPRPQTNIHQTYEGWISSHCQVSLVCLATYTLSRQETLHQLHASLVKGCPQMCVATSSRLLLFELPLGPFTYHNCHAHSTHTSGKLDPLLDIPLKNISKCILSLYEVGHMLVVMETGDVFQYSKTGRKMCDDGVRKTEVVCNGGAISVCYGSNKQQVLVLWRNIIIAVNLSSSKLPVVLDSCPILLGTSVYGQLVCMAVSPRQPFLLHLATPTHFILVDIRQPKEPIIFEPHLLNSEPRSITITRTTNYVLVLLCSSEDNLVLRYTTSLPLSLIGRGHMACIPSDALCCLKKCEVAGYLVGVVRSRLCAHQQLGWGAAVLSQQQTLVAIALTGFGDIFYQSFRYSSCMNTGPTFPLSSHYLHGYKLWIVDQLQRMWKVKRHQPVETRYPATVRDMSSIATSVLNVIIPGTQPFSKSVRSGQTEAIRSGHSPQTPVSTLQELCADLPVTTPLDKTLIDMWDNYVPPLKLFPPATLDTPPGGCGFEAAPTPTCNIARATMSQTIARATMSRAITCTTLSQDIARATMSQDITRATVGLEDDKHLFQDSILFESSHHCTTPNSSPALNRAHPVTTPTSKTRRRIGF